MTSGRRAFVLSGCGAGAAACLGAWPASAAVPTAHGGVVHLPAPGPLESPHPSSVTTPFGAAVARAISEPLYAVDAQGRLNANLALGLPERSGASAILTLRPQIRRHNGASLTAEHVVRSLRRAATETESAWLLAPIADSGGRPAIRALDDERIEFTMRDDAPVLARLLATTRLSIAGRGGQRILGTGPFTFASRGRDALLSEFRWAQAGAPYLQRLQLRAPAPRAEALRAFELGEVHASWHGETLYGGASPRPARTERPPPRMPVLLVPSQRGGLSSRATWSKFASVIDRNRLRRVGVWPSASLGPGIPSPALGPASGGLPSNLVLPIVAGEIFSERTASVLTAILDQHGCALRVNATSRERYAAMIRSESYDFRIKTVMPPLPGRSALVGAALAAAGQAADARTLASTTLLRPRAEVAAFATRLHAIVLGFRNDALSYDARLGALPFDELGLLDLAELSLPRGTRFSPRGGAP